MTFILIGANWNSQAQTQDSRPASSAKPESDPSQVVTQNGTTLPEAPAPVPAAGDPLYAPVATAGSQSFHDKLMAYAVDTFGPRALVTEAIPAGIAIANPPPHYPREWRQGAQAFGRVYGDELARQSAMQTARFATGVLLHEDFRYRPSDSRNGLARAGHAIMFTFVDRSDTGHARPALANFAGAAAGGYVPNAYLPRGWDDVTHADIRTGERMAGFAANNVLREFEPEILHTVKRLHLPFPRIPVPEWWKPMRDEDAHP